MSSDLNAFENLKAEEKTTAGGKKLRVGIIGTGWIADTHVNAYAEMEDVELVAGADLVPGKAEKFFKDHNIEGVKCYGSHKELLEHQDELRLDAVSVCTYNTQHAVCTIDSLKKGINVLLEKPMCVTLEEAVEIRKAEKESGKIVSVGFQPRFDENSKMVKEVVESGVLGRIYYIQTGGGRRRGIPLPFGTSFIEKETGGIGALGDIGCYALDIVLNAIGYPKPLSVVGYTSDFFGKDPNYIRYRQENHPEYSKIFGVDDFAAGLVRLEGDIILDFRIAWAMNIDSPCDTIILGTKAGLRIPATTCWNGYPAIGGPLKLYTELDGNQVVTEIPERRTDGLCFTRKIRTFLDAVKAGGEAPVPTSEIIYNQAILAGINKSAELKHEIQIEIPEI